MKLDEARETYQKIKAPRSMQADLEARFAAARGSDPFVWSLAAAAGVALLAVAIVVRWPEQVDDAFVAAISPATLGSMISEFSAEPRTLALATNLTTLPSASVSGIDVIAIPTLPDTPNPNWLEPVENEDENR